ncbi:MAG: DUF5615 family PIN-like protein [Bacteroidota bacterium]|jgi:predicted nuclease of predicted toxin-antitoxin system
MKLLFDQNISFKVSKRLQDVFPHSKHVSDLRLQSASDIDIWTFAKTNDYCIVTYDWDFIDLSTLYGFPPKIILLRFGNSSVENMVEKFNSQMVSIINFLESSDTAFLEIH